MTKSSTPHTAGLPLPAVYDLTCCDRITPLASALGGLYIGDQDVIPVSAALETVQYRAAEPLVPGLAAFADDDDLDRVFVRERQDGAGDILAAEGHGNAAKLLCQLEVLAEQPLRGRIDASEVFERCLDVNRV